MTNTGTVTVLFIDVVGPKQLRTGRADAPAQRIPEAHVELVRQQVGQHGGQQVMPMGDSFMVAFDSARGAVDCAVAVQRALAEHNRKNPEGQVQVRIAMNTGEAVRKEYDLFGAAVDAAARILSRAAGGQILVSDATRTVIGEAEDVALLDRGRFWLKGFPERWRLYEVLWQQEAIKAGPAAPTIAGRTPFVGREKERAELRGFLDQTQNGQGALVMITGEPGVGKTRLCEELAAEARGRGFLTLTGHCYEMKGTPPYIAFVEIIELAARIVEPGALRAALGDSAPAVARLVPALYRLVPDIPRPAKSLPEQERRYLFTAAHDFMARAGRVQPLLLVLEDLQWADDPTLLLLQHIVHRLHGMPVLIAGTYRGPKLEVDRPFAFAFDELLSQPPVRRMPLRRLPETGVAAMLQGRSGQEPPAPLVQATFTETEGNPFFVEELFRHLAEEGKLFDAEGRWRVDLRVEELDVPENVRLVIDRRLKRVSEECRRVLTAASVVGRGFSIELLEHLAALDEDTLLDAIDEAERAQLISSAAAGTEVR
ncbi:MAG: DUF2791 family P-loop domain-containing protein, partial [Candidatus Hydrogenedentota bacterium]